MFCFLDQSLTRKFDAFNYMQFRLAYVAPETRVVGAGELEYHPKKIAMNYVKGFFLIDLLVILPLPQVRTLIPRLVDRHMLN